MLNFLKSPPSFAHYIDSVLPVNPNEMTIREIRNVPPMAHVCPEHIKVNVRSLLHSTHSTTVEETKYTYEIIRRHINDALSR